MDYQQNLYYGIGQLAYAIAKVDGTIQPEEHEKFLEIVSNEAKKHSMDFDFAGIIFEILERDHEDFETAYSTALRSLKLSSHLIDDNVEKLILEIAQRIAAAFPPISLPEALTFAKIKEDIRNIRQKKLV